MPLKMSERQTMVDRSWFDDSYRPKWFHPKGFLMRLEKGGEVNRKGLVVIHNRVSISKHFTRVLIYPAGENRLNRPQWGIHWVSNHVESAQIWGTLQMGTELLRSAIGLRKAPSQYLPPWFLEFGADTGAPGRFIRKGDFLNLPGPGDGTWWNPNISIWLDDEIKEAVSALIVART